MKKRNSDLFSGKGQKLWKKAKTLIPGGNQLISKRVETFLPELWPAYYSKAKGAEVWDLDGRKLLDMSIMGVGACVLGYADPDVNAAVIDAVKRSDMSTLNSPDEVELAELLCDLHPWADMVRYARTGGESMAVAARIARAYTKKDVIAFCGYHGWADWYMSANLADKKALDDHCLPGIVPNGIPQGLKGSIYPFHYNKLDELEAIVKTHKGNVAAIIMEPVHTTPPEKGFLERVRAIADEIGAVLVFDEITIGWRMNIGGSHLLYGVNPDMAIFAKAVSNGHPMAAVIGKREVMQAAQDTFISSTYWTDRIGPAAALATIKKMKKVNLPKHLKKMGEKRISILEKASRKHGVPIINAQVPYILTLNFTGDDQWEAMTLFSQEMLRRGILAGKVAYASYAQNEGHLKRYEKAVNEVFAIIAHARTNGGVKKYLEGPVMHPGVRRLN